MERIDQIPQGPDKGKRLLVGLIFIVFGVFVFSKHMGWFPRELHHVIFSWKTLIIVIGFLGLIYGKHTGLNLTLILVGSFFIIGDIYNFPLEFRRLILPFMFIFLGLMMIFHKRHPHPNKIKWKVSTEDSSDYIDNAAIFGGGKVNIISDSFKGGRITSIFGGSEINLNNCKLADGIQVIDVFMVF